MVPRPSSRRTPRPRESRIPQRSELTRDFRGPALDAAVPFRTWRTEGRDGSPETRFLSHASDDGLASDNTQRQRDGAPAYHLCAPAGYLPRLRAHRPGARDVAHALEDR